MTLSSNHVSYRHFKAFRTAFYGSFFLACFVLVSLSPALASHVVENIQVDVTADNAVAAREKAFEEAQIKGYEMLAERLLSEEDMASFEVPDINTVSLFVQDYEVTNEKLSAVRYKGTYTIRFSPRVFATRTDTAPNSYAQQADRMPYEQQTNVDQSGIMVLPFYENVQGQRLLWGQPNPFREAWLRYIRRGNQPLEAVIPEGDENDRMQIKDNQSNNYNPARVNAMRIRYQTSSTKIVVAKPETSSDGSVRLLITIYNSGNRGAEFANQFTVPARRGEGTLHFYDRAVNEVANLISQDQPASSPQLQNASTQYQQQQFSGPASSLRARLSFNSIREWVQTKTALERASGVRSVQVQSMSPQQAMLEINFAGQPEQLQQSLQQVGVRMDNPEPPLYASSQQIYQLYRVSTGNDF